VVVVGVCVVVVVVVETGGVPVVVVVVVGAIVVLVVVVEDVDVDVVVVEVVGTYGLYVALISNQYVPESASLGALDNNNKLLGTTLPYASSLTKALNALDVTLLPVTKLTGCQKPTFGL
jgi:hypothetical protein